MIFIDTREQFRERALPIFQEANIEYEEKALKVGDYLIETNEYKLLIERKSANDFVSTFGNLQTRIPSMMMFANDPMSMSLILIEGNVRYNKWGNALVGKRKAIRVTRKQINNFLLSVQMKGIKIFFSKSYEESIKILCWFHEYLSKDTHNIEFRTDLRNIDNVVSFWRMFPGIGEKRAMTIYDMLKDLKTGIKVYNEVKKRGKE